VLTGGFGAEFGRSIGGVVNITTKSGTNSWEGGVSASVSPTSLRSKYKDLFDGNTGFSGNAATDNTLYQRNSDRKVTEPSLGAYLGGPIVQDKLFMFAAVERIRLDDERMAVPITSFGSTGFNSGGWAERRNTTDRYLFKFDWNISKEHALELTLFGDTYKQNEKLFGYNVNTAIHDGTLAQAGRPHQHLDKQPGRWRGGKDPALHRLPDAGPDGDGAGG